MEAAALFEALLGPVVFEISNDKWTMIRLVNPVFSSKGYWRLRKHTKHLKIIFSPTEEHGEMAHALIRFPPAL